jgi:hypothetical protein
LVEKREPHASQRAQPALTQQEVRELLVDLFAEVRGLRSLCTRKEALLEQVQALETYLEVIERAVELFWVEHDLGPDTPARPRLQACQSAPKERAVLAESSQDP